MDDNGGEGFSQKLRRRPRDRGDMNGGGGRDLGGKPRDSPGDPLDMEQADGGHLRERLRGPHQMPSHIAPAMALALRSTPFVEPLPEERRWRPLLPSR
jgi:hypothetical protein